MKKTNNNIECMIYKQKTQDIQTSRNIYPQENSKEIMAQISKKIGKIRRLTLDPYEKEPYIKPYLLAHMINEKTSFITKMESGKQTLDIFTFINICNALEISSITILSEFIVKDQYKDNLSKLDSNAQKAITDLIQTLLNSNKENMQNSTTGTTFNRDILVKRLHDFRESKGYSQRALSDKIHTSHSYINEIENGNKCPSLSNFIDICNALECTPNDLLRPFIGNKDENLSYSNLTSENQKIVDTLIKVLIDIQENGKEIPTSRINKDEANKRIEELQKRNPFAFEKNKYN